MKVSDLHVHQDKPAGSHGKQPQVSLASYSIFPLPLLKYIVSIRPQLKLKDAWITGLNIK